MKMVMNFKVYCTNCDTDGGYVDCLVSVNGSTRNLVMQFPEEVLPKGWRYISPPSGKTYYGEPLCPKCYETMIAMGKISS